MKQCQVCKNEFEPYNKRSKYCSQACNKKAYYKRSKDKWLEHGKEYYSNNREKIIEQNKQYYSDNKDTVNQYQKEYRKLNKEVRNTQSRKYYQDNIDRAKQYQKDNREKINKWYRDAHKNNTNYKIARCLRSRLSSIIKNHSKVGSAIRDLGCSVEFLKKHLENQFTEGMTWNNHALHGWHIDHIKPLSKFDLTNLEEFRKPATILIYNRCGLRIYLREINMSLNTRRCLICKRPNDTCYWHVDPDTKGLWVYCKGVCSRGYSLYAYCAAAGISVSDFLKNKIDFKEATPNEVTRMEWPRTFIPLSDPKAKAAVDYLQNVRGLEPGSGMYYDVDRNGIAFPYFFGDVFVGAQIRFIKPWEDKDGHLRKIDTLPGTRLGLLYYNWGQQEFMANIKGVIVVEGAFDVQALQQALYAAYGNALACPWRVVACSGSGATKHQLEQMRDVVKKGYTVIVAPDSDQAGLEMGRKFKNAGACTHIAFTGEIGVDWNDVYMKNNNPKSYIQWFMSKVSEI